MEEVCKMWNKEKLSAVATIQIEFKNGSMGKTILFFYHRWGFILLTFQ